VISFTTDNEFFKGKTETFPMMRLYASRTKRKWSDKPHGVRLAPAGWKKEKLQAADSVQARLVAQVFEVNPHSTGTFG
jgi:hypothetical protein